METVGAPTYPAPHNQQMRENTVAPWGDSIIQFHEVPGDKLLIQNSNEQESEQPVAMAEAAASYSEPEFKRSPVYAALPQVHERLEIVRVNMSQVTSNAEKKLLNPDNRFNYAFSDREGNSKFLLRQVPEHRLSTSIQASSTRASPRFRTLSPSLVAARPSKSLGLSVAPKQKIEANNNECLSNTNDHVSPFRSKLASRPLSAPKVGGFGVLKFRTLVAAENRCGENRKSSKFACHEQGSIVNLSEGHHTESNKLTCDGGENGFAGRAATDISVKSATTTSIHPDSMLKINEGDHCGLEYPCCRSCSNANAMAHFSWLMNDAFGRNDSELANVVWNVSGTLITCIFRVMILSWF
jgi:hypothetical protein